MSGPEITVIIPAYNVADFILPCLASVMAQTHPRWRCIVIDDSRAMRMLIRADGYVAWSGSDTAQLRAALTRWFG